MRFRCEGGFEREGVGEVGGGLDVDLPVDGHVPETHSDLAVLGGLGPLRFGFLGVEQVAGVVHGPVDLRVRAPVGGRGDVLVDEPGAVLGEQDGARRDLAGLPHRHLARDHSLPESREAVAGLDGVAEVPLPRVGRHPQGEGELGDAELRDQRRTGSGDRELVLGAVDHRRVQDRLDRVHHRPLDRHLEAPNLGSADRVGLVTDSVEHPGRGVRGVDGCGRCHGSTQALTTDIQTPKTLWLTGMWTNLESISARLRPEARRTS